MTRQNQNPIWALTLARLKEFLRRPEALFWVYFFPILMVIVLGVAFRNKPQEIIYVDILDNEYADALTAQLEPQTFLKIRRVQDSDARKRLRTGKSLLLVTAKTSSLTEVNYRYDKARPGSKMARDQVDRILQKAGGRKDVVSSTDTLFDEPGGRYVDFLVPGLLAMGLMGGGLWGVGFAIVDMRIRKLLKRFYGDSDETGTFLDRNDEQSLTKSGI